jgi:hypothetical protein
MQDCAQKTERRHKNQANKTTHTHKIRGADIHVAPLLHYIYYEQARILFLLLNAMCLALHLYSFDLIGARTYYLQHNRREC